MAAKTNPYHLNKHRDQLVRYQNHALLHSWGNIVECDGIPSQKMPFDLLCPICLTATHADEITLDHAPQQASQSRFGDRYTVVPVCRRCNTNSGATYEGRAAEACSRFSNQDRKCARHSPGDWSLDEASGLYLPTARQSRNCCDLKTAYLLAFQALGYSWVLTRRLDGLRSAIVEGLDSTDWVSSCLEHHNVALFVREHSHPFPHVEVSGRGYSVRLPCHDSPADLGPSLGREMRGEAFAIRVPATTSCSAVKVASIDFPGTTPGKAWDGGALHKLDRRCTCAAGHHVAKAPVAERQALIAQAFFDEIVLAA